MIITKVYLIFRDEYSFEYFFAGDFNRRAGKKFSATNAEFFGISQLLGQRYFAHNRSGLCIAYMIPDFVAPYVQHMIRLSLPAEVTVDKFYSSVARH